VTDGTDSAERPVALVTGASSGIGAACARALATAGYRVALNHLGQSDAAEAIARSVDGGAFEADVSDPAAVAAMVDSIERDLGPITLAVCNAGTYTERLLDELDDDLWERTVRVNLGGCYHVARAVASGLRRRGGAIVTIASEMAFVGGTASSHYVASKAAVLGLTRALARELAPTVRVNAVAPGPVDTPLLPERDKGPANTRSLPLGRIGRPEEIADVVVALAASTWTTGAVWSVNGGAVIE
jgi:NAD(P)-dependent dehydrogenase (short-subunit alcohol dehydrogenase family)